MMVTLRSTSLRVSNSLENVINSHVTQQIKTLSANNAINGNKTSLIYMFLFMLQCMLGNIQNWAKQSLFYFCLHYWIKLYNWLIVSFAFRFLDASLRWSTSLGCIKCTLCWLNIFMFKANLHISLREVSVILLLMFIQWFNAEKDIHWTPPLWCNDEKYNLYKYKNNSLQVIIESQVEVEVHLLPICHSSWFYVYNSYRQVLRA